MKKPNSFLQWLKRPRGFFLALVYIAALAAIVSSIVLVVLGNTNATLDYVSYALFSVAAILLGYTIYTIIIYAPSAKSKIKEKMMSRPFTAEILADYGFKTAVFAAFSFAVSAAFAVMNLVSAIKYGLAWYASLAGYYAVLLVLRGGTIISARKAKKKYADDGAGYDGFKWRLYRANGALLVLFEIAMAAAVTQMILSGRPTRGGQIMAITNAAYTFLKMGMALYNIFKAKKFNNPVTQSLRNINFADACMSITSLTVLLLATFGEENELLAVKACVGFAACAVTIAMAAMMIIKSCKELKKAQIPETGENEENEKENLQ